MLANAVRAVWSEDRAPQAPARVWRDWLLVVVLALTATGEGLLRADLVWRPVVLPLTVALVFPLLWRRTHPLTVVVVVFGALTVLDVAALIGGQDTSLGLNTTVYVLVLPYTLLRWGSGREAVLGLAQILLTFVIAVAGDYTGPVDTAVAFLLITFPAVLGASIRFWCSAGLRQLDQVRLREREQLARELHDTVAHHVSGIVIRAQAGQVVAETSPEAAVEALRVIEQQGSRTLAEMRIMVAALRDRDEAEVAPQRGVTDLERLAHAMTDRPRVEVHLSGELDDLRPSVGAAIYRIGQESITNAVRHARHATRIVVRVTGHDDHVRLTVRDDGDTGAAARNAAGWNLAGFGLVGMVERATLLGGTLEAGPAPDRGWLVSAVLPRSAAAR